MEEKNITILTKPARKIIMAVLVLIAIFLVFKLFLYLAPFIISLIIALLIEPLIRFLTIRFKISRKLAAPLVLLLVLCVIGFLLIALISKLIAEIVSISSIFPDYYSKVYGNINNLIEKATGIYLRLPPGISDNIEGVISNLSNSIRDIIASFFKSVINIAVSIPEVLLFVIVTILSTYFFTSDRDRIFSFVKAQFSDNLINKIKSLKIELFSALFGYIRAQLILMSITFTIMLTGFSIAGIKHALLVAFTVSFIDALPILGTGAALVPWSLYNLFTGEINAGISILIVYGVVLITRQLTEPRVLSYQIGLHPLATLLSMYTGLQLFGFLGFVLGPTTLLVLKNIFAANLKRGLFR